MLHRAESFTHEEPRPGRRAQPKILSLCCLYPNPLEPRQGIFVQRRLQSLAELTEVRIVSPLALVQYGSPKGSRLRMRRICPVDRQDGNVSVLAPRWFYPPLSGSLTPVWLFAALAHPLKRLRRNYPFEILDTHFGYPEGIAGALLSTMLGIPFTMTLRGNEPKHSRGISGRWWMGWALRRATRVFTVSERLRQFAIRSGARPERVKTIPNGIEPAVFFPRDRESCRIKHGFPAGRRLIVSAGALVERKGHHRVIEALKFVRETGTDAYLAIAGGPGPEGAYERQLRERTSALGLTASVRFLGPVSSDVMAELMSAADVCCLASTNEGWPNVVHEALACGTPVVATDVGAVPDMLVHGRHGLVVPVNDPPALVRALQEALAMDWDRAMISDFGRARSWHQVATEVLGEMQTAIRETEELLVTE